MLKTIQISDQLFWGYNEIIDINNFDNFNDLGLYMKKELIGFLKNNNLLNLAEKANDLILHNHKYIYYDDLYKTNDNIIYMCGGYNCNN